MSPLRYPGSKRKMLPSIQLLIRENSPRPSLFVEPFCGGASISLGLIEIDAVDRVLLADLDPLVAAFWIEATTNPERLIKNMLKEPVTVDRWDYWRQYRPRSIEMRAMKCLFLNRTTFSGIIGGNAGPIGGRKQESEYTISCRFQKEPLARRIRNVGRLAAEGRIVGAFEESWTQSIRRAEDMMAGRAALATVLYLDPPYIEKAIRLYERPFSSLEHQILGDYLTNETEHRWILSYDSVPLVLEQYRGKPGVREYRVTHHYTMRGSRRSPVPGREVLFTNLPAGPKQHVNNGRNS